jgi:hypothetical protein
MKKNPVTGKDVPDETARVEAYRYIIPRQRDGRRLLSSLDPPFIGNKRMRERLGARYLDALGRAYPKVSKSTDSSCSGGRVLHN